MSSLIKLITSIMDYIYNFILVVLETNSKVMDNLVRAVIYVCQHLFIYALTGFNGISLALNDFIIFLLELCHGVLVILDIVGNAIYSAFHITSQACEKFFFVTFALYSLTLSIFKTLVRLIVLLAETLQSIAVLIVSSCMLFLQSTPLFISMLFRSSIALIMQAIQSTINSICDSAQYIHNSFLYFLRNAFLTICDLPADFYIGSFLLMVIFLLSKKIWQTYQRNGPPQCLLLLPHLLMNLMHCVATKLFFCGQRMFSLFTYTHIVEDSGDDLSEIDSVEESDNTLNMEDINNVSEPSSSRNLKRKPLLSLRNGRTLKETSEEECELSARTLMAELEKERDRQLCIICQDKPKNIIILPCRHLCMCSTCHWTILASTNMCPLCRHEIYDCMNVFF